MKTINHHLSRAKQEIDHLQKTSSTEAGQTNQTPPNELIDAINQIFSIFRINYHNQFYSAFNDGETLNSAKKLWLHNLRQFNAKTLLQAANQLVGNSEYIPSLSKFINNCDQIEFALPSVRQAYAEACYAGQKPSAQQWSHPVIYHTGKNCGWFELRNMPESQSWPLFKEQYAIQCEKIRRGEVLALPASNTEQQKNQAKPLDNEQQKAHLAALKASLETL